MPQAIPGFLSLADAHDEVSSHYAAPSSPSTVYVLCSDAVARQSLESVIESAGWHAEGRASSDEFLLGAEPTSPNCLVLDLALPGRDGVELLARLPAEGIEMPIICIMDRSDVSMTVKVMKAGAGEVLIKPFENDVLLDAIAQALERSRRSLSHHFGLRVLCARYGTLSGREREIMALVVRGRLNKQIAGALGISEITVKAHRGKMMHKMRARSVAQLVVIYARIGPDSSHV